MQATNSRGLGVREICEEKGTAVVQAYSFCEEGSAQRVLVRDCGGSVRVCV